MLCKLIDKYKNETIGEITKIKDKDFEDCYVFKYKIRDGFYIFKKEKFLYKSKCKLSKKGKNIICNYSDYVFTI